MPQLNLAHKREPRIFTKRAVSTDELIAHLIGRGLEISDKEQARVALETVGYYRLLSYMRPFQRLDSRFGVRMFVSSTTIDQVLDLYDFDRELRLLCIDGIERIEIAIRARIVHELATRYGPHFYQDPSHYKFGTAPYRLLDTIRRAKHQAMAHYRTTYTTPAYPPIWVAMEGLTLGALSHLYSSLLPNHRKAISKHFGYHESILRSWLKTTTALRNLCAHHCRLWNTRIPSDQPKRARRIAHHLLRSDTFYAKAVVLVALLEAINRNDKTDWVKRFISLLQRYPLASLTSMGFVDNWMHQPPWAES